MTTATKTRQYVKLNQRNFANEYMIFWFDSSNRKGVEELVDRINNNPNATVTIVPASASSVRSKLQIQRNMERQDGERSIASERLCEEFTEENIPAIAFGD